MLDVARASSESPEARGRYSGRDVIVQSVSTLPRSRRAPAVLVFALFAVSALALTACTRPGRTPETRASASTSSVPRPAPTSAPGPAFGPASGPAAVTPALVEARLAELAQAKGAVLRRLRVGGGALFAIDEGAASPASLLELSLDAAPTAARVVVDPRRADETGQSAIASFAPSPDGRLVAVVVARAGEPSGELRVFDARTGKERGDVLTSVSSAGRDTVAWCESGAGLWYVTAGSAVAFHALGARESAGATVLGADVVRDRAIALVSGEDGRVLVVRVFGASGATSGATSGASDHYLVSGAAPTAKPVRLSRGDEEITSVKPARGGKVFAVAKRAGAGDRVLVFSPPYDSSQVVTVASADGPVDDLAVTRDALYLVDGQGGHGAPRSRVRRVPLAPKAEPLAREPSGAAASSSTGSKPTKGTKKKQVRPPPADRTPPTTIAPGERGVASAELPLPPQGRVIEIVTFGDDLLLRTESAVAPARWLRYRGADHRVVTTALVDRAAYDSSDVAARTERCGSGSMTVLERRGALADGAREGAREGARPVIVAPSSEPLLRPWQRVWLDAGGVIALTNEEPEVCAKALVTLGVTRKDLARSWKDAGEVSGSAAKLATLLTELGMKLR